MVLLLIFRLPIDIPRLEIQSKLSLKHVLLNAQMFDVDNLKIKLTPREQSSSLAN